MYKFAKLLSVLVLAVAVVITGFSVFLTGYKFGYNSGVYAGKVSATTIPVSVPATSTPQAKVNTKTVYVTPKPVIQQSWGGPQLWEAVNKRRVELGVNPLQVKEEICTLASIRLNQLLALGTLDGHKGFTNMPGERPDLKWVFDKYSLSEFLVSGATSAQNAVDLWENTLGHKELLSGGQFVWGCIYAQSGFGVAIAVY